MWFEDVFFDIVSYVDFEGLIICKGMVVVFFVNVQVWLDFSID